MSEQALLFTAQISVLTGIVILGTIYLTVAITNIGLFIYEQSLRIYRLARGRVAAYAQSKSPAPTNKTTAIGV